MQAKYGIVVLNQTGDTVTLYCNCVKYGYTILRYSHNDTPENVIEMSLTSAEVTISDLLPGEYTFCAVNTNGKFSLPVFIEISVLPQEQFLSNILITAGLDHPDCFQILKQIKTKNYIEELYSLWLSRKKDSPLDIYGEKMLSAFTLAYNLEQEHLNGQFLFSFRISDENIAAADPIKYRFVPYEFDPTNKTWILEKENISNDINFLIYNNKPSVLRQISVLSDFNVVRRYYHYQPSETLLEAILERQISKTEKTNEELYDLLSNVDLTELKDDEVGQNTVLSLSHIAPKRPVFKKPELEFDTYSGLIITIPDYEAFALLDQKIYLAALELDEVFNETPAPHKILITDQIMTIRPSSFLINSDKNYIFYVADKNNAILSEVTLFSFDETFPAEAYTKSYLRIAHDEYVRKLNAIFRNYRKQDWNLIASLLDRFLLTDAADTTSEQFLIQQILLQNGHDIRPDLWLQLVLLCQLTYYSDINQNFIQKQVYSKDFNVHVLPEQEKPYLIRTTKINESSITTQYCLGGLESTSIRIDRDDYIYIQCIDPENWKVSSIVFYNNRIKNGARYFYFPNLKVEVI